MLERHFIAAAVLGRVSTCEVYENPLGDSVALKLSAVALEPFEGALDLISDA